MGWTKRLKRAVKRVSRSVERTVSDIAHDPNRALQAYLTMGGSEAGRAADKGFADVSGKRTAKKEEKAAGAQAVLDMKKFEEKQALDEKNMDARRTATRQRDAAKRRQKQNNSGGRQATLLGASGSSDGSGGGKSLLGS